MTDRRDASITGTAEARPPAEKKKNKPTGVYITNDERKVIEQIAEQTGQKYHAVLKYAIAYFLKAYAKDPGIIQVETKQVFKQT